MEFRRRLLIGWQLNLLSLLLLLTLIVTIWHTFPEESSAVILHYSVGIGIDFIGESDQIQTLSLIGGLFYLANLGIGHAVYATSSPAAWILWGINPLVQSFLLIAYLLLWQLNR